MNKKTQLNEAKLAKAASTAVSESEMTKSQLVPGKPLPEGVDNPPIGQVGHYCEDPQGNYQPSWMQLMIHKTHDDMPERQYFRSGKASWRVKTGTWVDVPPEIITLLSNTVVEEIEMDLRTANPLSEDGGVQRVVNRIPRFSTSILPSA